jgi:uncharacterized lipoprotein YajG
MKWILLGCLFLAGCATSRTTIAVSGEVDGVEVAAYYELGGNHAARTDCRVER